MALISKIRNNSWLLITVIGLALAAFILMDMSSSGNRSSAGAQYELGTVNDIPVDYREFQSMEQALYSGQSDNTYGQKSYLWNYFVDKALVDQESEKLGLGVSDPEMLELMYGNNLSPVITQRFIDRNTGQIDRNQLNNIRQQIEAGTYDQNLYSFWSVQEKEIKKDRLQKKLSDLVSKTIYTPNWMAEMRSAQQNTTVDFDLVNIPYRNIADSDVSYTDADLTTYLNANKEKFLQKEETRTAEYAVFNIFPTASDSLDIKETMMGLKTSFINADNDSIFIANQEGVYDNVYFKRTELGDDVAESLFSSDVGSTFGPYIDQNQYRVTKVIDRMIIPDSVEARHILRRVTTQEELVVANTLIDSIITVINNGSTTFEDAASAYGTDATKTTGGDLGFAKPGQMVKPFNDMIFYQAKKGELKKVFSQFGIHLVEVTDSKSESNTEGVKYAYVYRDIIPSQETQDAEYNRIFDLLGANENLASLRSSLAAQNAPMLASGPLKQNDFTFPGLNPDQTPRDIIRWMFQNDVKVGDVSPEVFMVKEPTLYYNKQLLLAGVSGINAANTSNLAALKSLIIPFVTNEKKAELIASNISGANLNTAANAYGVEVQSVTGASLGRTIPEIGTESMVMGVLANGNQGDVFGPINGNTGVFYIKINNKTEAGPGSDLAAAKRLASSLTKRQVNLKLLDALKKQAKIEDNRYTFF